MHAGRKTIRRRSVFLTSLRLEARRSDVRNTGRQLETGGPGIWKLLLKLAVLPGSRRMELGANHGSQRGVEPDPVTFEYDLCPASVHGAGARCGNDFSPDLASVASAKRQGDS